MPLDSQQISAPILQTGPGSWPQDTLTKENFGLCWHGVMCSAMESMATSKWAYFSEGPYPPQNKWDSKQL